ncbi:Leucine rich repeat containing protein BspA family protein [Entamoeba marina]
MKALHFSKSQNKLKRTHYLTIGELLEVGKYMKTKRDFINIMLVNSYYQTYIDSFHFNPIANEQLFRNIQIQHLYSHTQQLIPHLNGYIFHYKVTYHQFLTIKSSETDMEDFDDKMDEYYNCNFQANQNIHSKRSSLNDSQHGFHFKHIELSLSDRYAIGCVIPNGINSIGNKCFCECCELTTLSIPKTVNLIGFSAFEKCSYLQNIHLPTSVTALLPNCFKDCIHLQSITISSPLLTLPQNCFFNCTSLTSITLPTTLTRIKSYCFHNCSSLSPLKLPISTIIEPQ